MRAAVVGVGPHGQRIVKVLLGLENVELAAVVDQNEAALAAVELPTKVAKYRSLDEIRPDAVEMVCIATNGPSHAKLALTAMERGVRRLLIEKPMACSVAECDQIIEKADETGTRVVVDHVRRYSPAYRWLRDRISSGAWGQPRCIWMQRPGIGLGCNGTHSFDTVSFLTGQEVKQVTGWVDEPVAANPRGKHFVDPGGLAILDLGSARAVVAQIEDGAGPTAVEIDLTAARVRVDEKYGQIEIVERDLSVKPGPGRPPAFQVTSPPDGLTGNTDMGVMVRGCVEDLISNNPVVSGVQSGRAAIEVLVACYLSHRRDHAPVPLPLTSPEDRNLWLPVT